MQTGNTITAREKVSREREHPPIIIQKHSLVLPSCRGGAPRGVQTILKAWKWLLGERMVPEMAMLEFQWAQETDNIW